MSLVLRDSWDGTGRAGGGVVAHVAFTGPGLDLAESAAGRDDALAAVAGEAGAHPVRMRQVHGDRVVVVTETLLRDGSAAEPPACDALVTALPGVALLARAADCVPVLLADPAAGVVAAVHAGRKGVAAGVVPAAVARMRALGAGTGAGEIRAWVGPHVCGECYEVPAELRAEVAAVVPQAHAISRWGTPALDLGAGVSAQLAAEGVHETAVDRCTLTDEAWPSYRRDGAAAHRFAGVIWMSAPPDVIPSEGHGPQSV